MPEQRVERHLVAHIGDVAVAAADNVNERDFENFGACCSSAGSRGKIIQVHPAGGFVESPEPA